METKNLDKLMEQATQGQLIAEHGSIYCDDATGSIVARCDGFDYAPRPRVEVTANAHKMALFGTHGPAMVTVLKSNLEVLKGCEFAMNTFLPDSKFVAQEGLNRIRPAIKEIETLLMKLDQEATCQK